MVQNFLQLELRLLRFPHARGDGPYLLFVVLFVFMFSPRPWGWSEARSLFGKADIVFPTPVGMVRTHVGNGTRRGSFPHARGDGPEIKELLQKTQQFSPRPWGWSAGVTGNSTQRHVFPTPVGMVRTHA